MPAFFAWLFDEIFTLAFWFQPLFYALHGWIATEMAIWMLFHPYKPVYIPGTRIQLPLTPGIFPRGRANLSRSIADTVTQTLLTEKDIHQQAERLITDENLLRVIEALLNSVVRELRNKEQLRQIYRYGEEVIPDVLEQLIQHAIDDLEADRPGQLRDHLTQLIDQTLPRLRLDYNQAEYVTDMLFSALLTPPYLRQVLVEGLSDENIAVIGQNISEQVGGVKGFLMRLVGFERGLGKVRDFMLEHPEAAEQQITEILDRLEIREKLAERISQFAFEDLAPETRQALAGYGATALSELLVDHREDVSALVRRASREISRKVIGRVLQADLKAWLNEKRPDLKLELARFMRRYLHRELALMIAQVLPALNIGQLILEKMEQFSNQELEQMIYGICRRELRWMAFLGAFLGFWLGLLSNFINYFLRGLH